MSVMQVRFFDDTGIIRGSSTADETSSAGGPSGYEHRDKQIIFLY